ncbi:MAG: M23 family metallopeptidase [Ruminococcaceae bacterium]|nr:M23 family metallopeptidase [Oscillospiraceae bacterium]
MKRTKSHTKEVPKRKSGCFLFLILLTISLLFLLGNPNFKKNLDYFLRGEANLGAFFSDMQVSYQTHLTYPDFSMPIAGNITSPFGERINPLTNQPEQHTGIDIDISSDNQVKAAASGTVLKIGVDERFGNYIILSHDGNFSTCYAHLESVSVTEGMKITKKSPIGIAGESGTVTGPHLHFEIRKGEKRMNPALFLPK